MMGSSRHRQAGSYQHQAHRLATQFALSCGAACLSSMAWAGSWTHDSTNGAVTAVALPGGQVALARDGADLQARTITYESVQGDTTTITRAYGPSGHKAVEAENGTVRQHVYGAGLAPLLRVEGDDSLTYQVGMDTISANGGATVAHRIADIKRSTVAVLDAQGQTQQRVAYSTLGQSKGQQQSSNVYVNAGQLSGYEGLSLVLLSKEAGEGMAEEPVQDQLIDNRARLYFSLAGRFLSLDAAGKARSYEARGNNWAARVDYDGNIDELIAMLQRDPNLVATFLIPEENESDFLFIREFWQTVTKLEGEKIPFFIGSDSLLKESKKYSDNTQIGIGMEKRIGKLIKNDLLKFVNSDSLIDYNREKFEGSNSEKIKLLLITRKTFTDYMAERKNLRNFLFISNEATMQDFFKQKFWEGRSVKEIMKIEKAQKEDEFQYFKPTTINIYTQSEIYENYQVSKLWPQKKEELKVKAQDLQEMPKDQRIMRLQKLMDVNNDPDADNNQGLSNNIDDEEKQLIIQKKGNSQLVNNNLHQEEAEEESVEHQISHGSCKGCILQ